MICYICLRKRLLVWYFLSLLIKEGPSALADTAAVVVGVPTADRHANASNSHSVRATGLSCKQDMHLLRGVPSALLDVRIDDTTAYPASFFAAYAGPCSTRTTRLSTAGSSGYRFNAGSRPCGSYTLACGS
jgi:hypothetical protein